VADDVLLGVQAKGELAPSFSESGDSDLRVVDDLVTIGVGDESLGEVEGERSLPAVVIVLVFTLVLFVVLVASVRVLVLVPPFGALGRLLVFVLGNVAVVLGGRGGIGKSREESEEHREFHYDYKFEKVWVDVVMLQ
jgi:hypothetical protein